MGNDATIRTPGRVLLAIAAALGIACGDASTSSTDTTAGTDATTAGPGSSPTGANTSASTSGSTGGTASATTSAATGDTATSASTSASASATTSASGPSTDPMTTTSASMTASTSSASATTGDPTTDGTTGEPPFGLEQLGTLVVLGDSISDGGGQPPYYYNLLRDSLTAHYGPITYVNKAQSGSKTGALVGQIDDLPQNLPGPVAVAITSGGNDMKEYILQIVLGLDGPAKMMVSNNVNAALTELLTPGRFGPGVDVYVFEGNIYDASDGQGDFGMYNCAFGEGFPMLPVDAYFDAWNEVIADAVTAHGQTAVDMHGYFYGHGYHSQPNWYASDCTHPSAVGHAALRDLFFEHITGEPAP